MKIIIANTYKCVLYLIKTYAVCKFLSHREITVFFTFFFFLRNLKYLINFFFFFFLRTGKCGFIFLFCFNLNLFIFFKLLN